MIDPIDLIVETSRKNMEDGEKRFRELDNKATAIITITGVLISFLLGSGGFNDSSNIAKTLLVLTSVSFLVTIYYGVKVIKVRDVKIYTVRSLIETFKENTMDNNTKIANIIQKFAETEYDLFIKCKEKGEDLKISTYSLGLSISLLILYIIIYVSGISFSISFKP